MQYVLLQDLTPMKRHKLIALRRQHRFTQAVIAGYLDMHKTCYCRLENGKAILLEKVMLQLSRLYHCHLEDLIEDKKLTFYNYPFAIHCK